MGDTSLSWYSPTAAAPARAPQKAAYTPPPPLPPARPQLPGGQRNAPKTEQLRSNGPSGSTGSKSRPPPPRAPKLATVEDTDQWDWDEAVPEIRQDEGQRVPFSEEVSNGASSVVAPADSSAAVEQEVNPGAEQEVNPRAEQEVDPPVMPVRTLDSLEVTRSVEQAMKAKEALAKQSILSARNEVILRRAALQKKHEEEQLRLQEEDAQLQQLEAELKTGCSNDMRTQIEKLRKPIELVGREVATLEREVEVKREAMRRATDAYVDAVELLQSKKSARQKMEKDMLEIILSTGKAKDAKLTQVLSSVPVAGESVKSKLAEPACADEHQAEDVPNKDVPNEVRSEGAVVEEVVVPSAATR